MLASELIEEIRSLGSITPDTLDADILKAADAEIRTRLLPMVRTLNEEYLVRTLDVASVNGRVALPPRAMGAGVRLVQVVLGNGQLSPPLPRLDPAQDTGAGSGGLPYGFYFDGGGVVLLPMGASATVRVRYFARPGRLCLESDPALCAPVTNVVPGAVTTDITSAIAGGPTRVDIISGASPHQHKAIFAAKAGATFQNADLLETIVAGNVNGFADYVAVPDRTPYVALPEELGSTVAFRTAARILASLGYLQEAQAQYAMADTAQREAEQLLRPRADGNPKRLSGGTLASLGGRGPWGGW